MPWRPTDVLRALAAAAGALALTGAAEPSATPPMARVLLIGVGDYPALPERLHLAAPAGDVRRLQAALIGAGLDPAAITVMTEREGERPTRAAILAALRRLADEAAPGQQVLVYFSGHGAQEPARHPALEPDGLEEVYLASDASRWDAKTRMVRGAVADFELEAALQAIQARGARVWFVADACHAAGLTRGAALATGARAKTVSGADLGVPLTRTLLRARPREASPLSASGFTGFYAASPGALALERPMPEGASDAAPSSVFTFALARAVAQGRFRTLRDLALAVSATELDTGSGAPAPVFEGALDFDMLGLAPVVRSFRVKRAKGRLTVQAGALEGLETGAVVVLDAGGGTVGKATVTLSGIDAAEIEAAGALPDGPLSARLGDSVAAPSDGGRGRRLLAALAPLAGSAPGLKVEARLWRQGCATNPAARLGFPANARPFDLLAPTPLRNCDVVYARVSNDGAAALDLSPLYVDAEGAVVGLNLAPDDDVRLEPGQARFIALRIVTRDARGRALAHGVERLALVTAPAGERRFDLRGLAGPSALRGADQPLDRPGLSAQVFALRVDD